MLSLAMKLGLTILNPIWKVINKIWATTNSKRPVIAKRPLSSKKVLFAFFFSLVKAFILQENRLWHVKQIVSLEDNVHERSKPVCWEN